jgi:pimeloyl-ACP methyl ester carboxylesterase
MSPHRMLGWLLLPGLCLALPPSARGQLAPCAEAGVIFVANGSGDSVAASEGLAQVLQNSGTPLGVVTFRWSRFQRSAADYQDLWGRVYAGWSLAQKVAAYRQACPDRKVYLVGHSAGCHVILTAAAYLPEGSVDRIVLLAAAVSSCYDLRPALRCARDGIDSYFSPRDEVLFAAAAWYGTAEGCTGRAAGEVGFACPDPAGADALSYGGLRQYRWDQSVAWTGYFGGHYGPTRSAFIGAYVLPRLLGGGGSAWPGY